MFCVYNISTQRSALLSVVTGVHVPDLALQLGREDALAAERFQTEETVPPCQMLPTCHLLGCARRGDGDTNLYDGVLRATKEMACR